MHTQLKLLSLPLLLLLLALQVTIAAAQEISWDKERLQWLVVTKPDATQVQLNCTSQHVYPFTLLNDSSSIGIPGSHVRRVWWILPDGKVANASYNDGNRRCVDEGVGLLFNTVTENVYGLYHCAAEASYRINSTHLNESVTQVFYYKRGLNLYGADIYSSTWDKYKRNTLIGSLTAGVFILAIIGYALLEKLGVWAKCLGSNNTVAVAVSTPDILEVGDGGAATKSEAAEMKTPAGSVAQSRASVRSRRSEKTRSPEAAEAETRA